MKKIKRKEFDNFTNDMWKRLKRGEEKYGSSFVTDDIKKELSEELKDVANYAFMLWLKVLKINKRYKVK